MLTNRHCASVFVLVLTRARQPLFPRSSAWKGIFVVYCCFRRLNFFGKTCGLERSISNSELSAVGVVNAYGSVIGVNEDHVDDSSSEVR